MKKNNKKGFTLVELVIVVAVMAILVAVAIPTVKSITGTAKKATFDTNCRTIESVLKLAEAEEANDAALGAAAAAGSLDAGEVKTALENAKLGITGSEASVFYYHPGTGIVDGTTASGAIKITYATTGTVSTEAVS